MAYVRPNPGCLLHRIETFMNRTDAILVSFFVTVSLNAFAGAITLAYANGTTIVETNPSSIALLRDFGAFAILVHAVEIAFAYPLAYIVSRLISSKRRLFSAKRIYLFAFAMLVTLLPVGAFVDLLSDALVVGFTSDALVGTQNIVGAALSVSVVVAAILTRRRWTLPAAGQMG